MADGNFIQGAIQHPGVLHEQLGVPKGQKIPRSRLLAAAHSKDKTLARRARFALTLEKLARGKR